MAPDFFTTNHHSARASRAAWTLLAFVALAQGVAVAMARREHRPAVAAAALSAAADVPPVTIPAEPDPFFSAAEALPDPHPELLMPAGLEPLLPEAAEPVLARPAVAVSAPLDVPITDEASLAHLDEGIYLRDRGDMAGAAAELRAALEAAPEHPKLLYQLALTLDGMGQEAKASAYWRKLRLLGADAGNYYQLAVERLKEGGSLAPSADVVFEGEEARQGRFTIQGMKEERLPDTAAGEWLRFEGTIERHQAEPAEVARMDIRLHLFDEVNGQRIDRTTALPPMIQWLEEPVDWAQGSERFSFEYRQPPLSPDELVKLGRRKYYGYAIEFRYDGNQLQDLVAEPAQMGDLARELPEGQVAPPGGEVLDMGGPGALPGQPDAVLFPGDKLDR